MPDIFVSYARDDRIRVANIVEAFKAKGWEVWWDPNLTAGQRFDKVIQQSLHEAKRVVAIWSPNSINSQWVKDDAGEGASNGKLVPVTIENAKPPIGFRQIQTVDLTGWTGSRKDPRLQDLLRALECVIHGVTVPAKRKPRSVPRP